MKSLSVTAGVLSILAAAGVLAGCSAGDSSVDDKAAALRDQSQSLDINGFNVRIPNGFPFLNEHGFGSTHSDEGYIDTSNPFFKSLGSNGRSCATCHTPDSSFGLSKDHINLVFLATRGKDPLFAPVDGTNTPNDDISTVEARRQASSLLLSRGVFRMPLSVPATAEFEVTNIDDPYNFATPQVLSLYRRPLPSSNIRFTGTIMWDGREAPPFSNLTSDFGTQANNANIQHAQATGSLDADTLTSIVNFQKGLVSAQIFDFKAGDLDGGGAQGGLDFLSTVTFTLNQNKVPFFNPNVITVFAPWASLEGDDRRTEARRAIARGEALFNTRFGRSPGFVNPAFIRGFPITCSTCHNHPGTAANTATSDSFPVLAFLNQGVSLGERRRPDVPLYTLRNKTTGAVLTTTDPGRALVTGKWGDMGEFKSPALRGLAARAPYFHDGSAATLEDVVDNYSVPFGFNFTDDEKADLVAFLSSL